MEHIAIDLGGRESQVCVRDAKGQIQEEVRVKTKALGTFLCQRPPSRVIIETCAEAFSVADEARQMHHEVRVVPATLAPSLGVGARRTKSDMRDARALSGVSCRLELPSVHIPSRISRERKANCTARESLVSARTQLINSVRGYLRTIRVTPRTGRSKTFPARVCKSLENHPDGFSAFVERQLLGIGDLTRQIIAADQELAQISRGDAQLCRLMTVPGVGPVTAIRFAAAVDDAGRFASASKVGAYLGLTPGEHSSGKRQRRTSITKAGSPRVRWTLGQAAMVAMHKCKNEPMSRWANEIAKRRGKAIAVVALTRKMAGILLALMRDGTVYNSARSARQS